jgi:guanylate kinase
MTDLGRLIVLSGPSGVGKTTVVRHLRESAPQLWVSVSATTRFPRPGESDGINYLFVNDDQFDRLLADDDLLEWATYAGHRYGTPSAPVGAVRASGKPVLLEIEIEGARQVRRRVPDSTSVFLAPPSRDVLVARLTGRGTEPDDVVAQRLARADAELAAAEEFDHVVVNDDLEQVVSRLVALATG